MLRTTLPSLKPRLEYPSDPLRCLSQPFNAAIDFPSLFQKCFLICRINSSIVKIVS